MNDVATERPDRENKATAPRYTGNRGALELWAEFASGVSVPVVRGRVRSYPGLRSAAPSTAPFYRAFASVGSGQGRVIDAGAGSGVGSAALLPQYDHVVAVDSDPRALAFIREYAPGVETMQSTLDEPLGGPVADAAIVVDVLGLVKDPARFLGALRGSVGARARLLVAEPSAFVAQRLVTPVRRAFSHRSLEALLVRGGFHATTWVADTGTFIGCVATAADDGAWEHFAAASRAADTNPDVAFAELAAAGRSGRRDVQREAAIATGELRLALNDGDGAARAFLDAAGLDANDPRPLAGLSVLALAGGSLNDAVELAARAAELDPTERRAAIALAWAADAAGHPDSFNVWRITERLVPDDLDVTSRLAAQAASRGDYAFAISVFERLRSYGDRLPAQFYVTLALMLSAEGRRADALLELRLARTLEPDNETVLELWSELGSLAS
ncbi:MAG TPA: methyltransferase domain-containing protein [Polyangiaceae bacterium]|jgi:tetratricopeptide (TPR) repeat protein|nr:methyltransferase domain-containing protein [Polyangiaceae bacterium]